MNEKIDYMISSNIQSMYPVVKRKGQKTKPSKFCWRPETVQISEIIVFNNISGIIKMKRHIKCIRIDNDANDGNEKQVNECFISQRLFSALQEIPQITQFILNNR